MAGNRHFVSTRKNCCVSSASARTVSFDAGARLLSHVTKHAEQRRELAPMRAKDPVAPARGSWGNTRSSLSDRGFSSAGALYGVLAIPS